MKLESIVRISPTYAKDAQAIKWAIEHTTHSVVDNWLADYPNTSLLLRRTQKVPEYVQPDSPYPGFDLYRATATVIPFRSLGERHLLTHQEVCTLEHDFCRKHCVWPNTLLLPSGFSVQASELCPDPYSDKPPKLFGRLNIVDNAPTLAIALL